MIQKKYTVKQIDDLRKTCENKWLYGTFKISNGQNWSRSYSQIEKDTGVEELVRTYMLAGITADELYKD